MWLESGPRGSNPFGCDPSHPGRMSLQRHYNVSLGSLSLPLPGKLSLHWEMLILSHQLICTVAPLGTLGDPGSSYCAISPCNNTPGGDADFRMCLIFPFQSPLKKKKSNSDFSFGVWLFEWLLLPLILVYLPPPLFLLCLSHDLKHQTHWNKNGGDSSCFVVYIWFHNKSVFGKLETKWLFLGPAHLWSGKKKT